MTIIQVREVVKRFGEITAVAGVDLDVEEGECFGLLGPNGAGKTTLVKMITAVSPLNGGCIRVAGMDVAQQPREIKSLIGVVPQEENLDPDFTVLQNLVAFARYFGIAKEEARARALVNLELFGLDGRQKAKTDELSGGMKRRLLIARGLLNLPKILVLDEPTVGLDPQTKHLVWQKLRLLKEQGMTQLVTTQNMDEAMRICNRLAIMHEGKIIVLGSPGELIAQYGGRQILEARPNWEEREVVLAMLKEQGFPWQEVEDTVYIVQPDAAELDERLKEKLCIVAQRAPTLEDVFLRLTGRSLTE